MKSSQCGHEAVKNFARVLAKFIIHASSRGNAIHTKARLSTSFFPLAFLFPPCQSHRILPPFSTLPHYCLQLLLLLLSIHLLCFALPAFHFYRRVFYKLLSRDVLDLLRRCTRYVDKVVLFRSVISVFAMVEFKTISLTRDLKQSRPSHSTPL